MSYARMDHAGWVQRQIDAYRTIPIRYAADKKRAAQGKGWYAAPEKLTEFHTRVFDILGIVGGGIYNAPISWDTVEWRLRNAIAVTWSRDLSTFGFASLTYLVVLCHEARIRCNIEASSRGYFSLFLSQRQPAGGFSDRHPNIAEATAYILEAIGPDHRIIYREPVAAQEAA